jgi:hypothetical protein
MNFELKDLPAKLTPMIAVLKRYVIIIFLVAVACLAGFLVFRVNQLTNAEPEEDTVLEQMDPKQLRIDGNLVKKLEALQEGVTQPRDNGTSQRVSPFTE